MHLHIDIETYSSADIKKVGAYKYTEAPDFEVLMVAYAIGDAPVRIRRVDVALDCGLVVNPGNVRAQI